MTTPSDASQAVELPPFSELARLTHWLDAKYARHKEIEDHDASVLLHTLWRAAQDRAARAQAEPVAWRWRYDAAKRWVLTDTPMKEGDEFEVQPLYVHQPAAPTIPQAAEVPGEAAWLVECDGKWPFLGHPGPIQWLTITAKYNGFGEREFTFTSDASKALRFARREDAEAAMLMHIGAHDRPETRAGFSVTEHMWPAAPTPTASAPKAEGEAAGWFAGTEDADGNPLVTIRADELAALAEFASGPGLSAYRIDGDMVRREVLAVRMQVLAHEARTQPPSEADRTREGGDVVAAAREVIRTWYEDVPMSDAADSIRLLERAIWIFGTTTSEGASHG